LRPANRSALGVAKTPRKRKAKGEPNVNAASLKAIAAALGCPFTPGPAKSGSAAQSG
jgi:hypothetical protein